MSNLPVFSLPAGSRSAPDEYRLFELLRVLGSGRCPRSLIPGTDAPSIFRVHPRPSPVPMHRPNSRSRISTSKTSKVLRAIFLTMACLGLSACSPTNGRTESQVEADAGVNSNDAGTIGPVDSGILLRAADGGAAEDGLEVQKATSARLTADAGVVSPPDRLAAARKRLHNYSGDYPLLGTDDLDGDGVRESWSWGCGGGSGFGGCVLEVMRPGSRAPFSLDASGSFGSFLQIAPISTELASRPKLLQGMIELDFGPTEQRRLEASDNKDLPLVDGSLAWLVAKYAPENQRAAVKPFKSM
jgi:hypothetical protein